MVIYEHALAVHYIPSKKESKEFVSQKYCVQDFRKKSSSWKKKILAWGIAKWMHILSDLDSSDSVFEINLQEKKINLFGICYSTESPKRKSMAHNFTFGLLLQRKAK